MAVGSSQNLDQNLTDIQANEENIVPTNVFAVTIPEENSGSFPIHDATAVVIDTGSSGCRVGFAIDEEPRVVIKFDEESSPIHYGRIVDDDKLAEGWTQAFTRKTLDYNGQSLLITTPTGISRGELENIAVLAFEIFEAQAILPFDQSVLSLYAAGKVTGLLLDCGHELTSSVPIVEGKIYHPGVVTSQLGGEDVSKYLGELLGRQNFLDEIKEKACRVRITPNHRNGNQKAECTLTNGEVISLGMERFQGPEILFNPSILNRIPGPLSIQETAYLAMRKCDTETRKILYQNIVLTGGSSMFDNFGTRLRNCLEILSPSETRIRMDDTHAAGRYMAWVGGSIMASSRSLNGIWITKQDYSECGPTMISNFAAKRQTIAEELDAPKNPNSEKKAK